MLGENIVYAVFIIYGILFFYIQIKTLNKRESLKGGAEPFGAIYVIRPLLSLENEFPENKDYTALFRMYTILRLISAAFTILTLLYFFNITQYLSIIQT